MPGPGYLSDTLTNFVSNLGTDRDKAMHSFFARLLLSQESLSTIYRFGGIGGKIVDCVAEDAGRKWREVVIPGEDTQSFNYLEDDLGTNEAFVDGMRWARLYGGAAGLIEIEGDDPATELNPDSVSPNKPVSGLLIRDRHTLSVDVDYRTGGHQDYVDLTDGQHWHPSRVLVFLGRKLPYHERIREQGWGASIFERVYRALLNEETIAAEIASLVHEAYVDHIGVKSLDMYLDGGEKQAAFERRYQLYKLLKATNNVALHDQDNEEYYNSGSSTAIANLAPVLERHANRIASIVDIPMTRLYGALASGLNTSSQVNALDYEAMVAGEQRSRFDSPLRYFDKLLCRSVYGRVPDGFRSNWVALGEVSQKEKMETFKIFAEAIDLLMGQGVIVAGHAADYLAGHGNSPLTVEQDFADYLLERDGADGSESRVPLPETGNQDPDNQGDPNGTGLRQTRSGVPTE